MSKEKGKELFWALHSLLDAVTNLNLRDFEAEAKAASASKNSSRVFNPRGQNFSECFFKRKSYGS
jgi:hypothetical protein